MYLVEIFDNVTLLSDSYLCRVPFMKHQGLFNSLMFFFFCVCVCVFYFFSINETCHVLSLGLVVQVLPY